MTITDIPTQDEAFALRRRGTSFAAIAKRLGMPNADTAQRAFRDAFRRLPDAEQASLRTDEAGRLGALTDRVRANPQLDDAALQRALHRVERWLSSLRPTTDVTPAPPRDEDAVSLDRVPEELVARIRSATAGASWRRVAWHPEARGAFVVHALCGDRVVVMELGERPDGSVAERTDTFLKGSVRGATVGPDGPAVVVEGPDGRRTVRVPAPLVALLPGNL